jgi:uncharacterized membrane protein YphA (DoxX/SURF4 family)
MVALWVATVLLAGMFALAGTMKLVNAEEAGKQFAAYGYPDWFRVLIAVVEIAGSLAILISRAAFWAAGALAVVMVGAAFTHLLHGEVPQAAVPLVLLALLVAVGYFRRPFGTLPAAGQS